MLGPSLRIRKKIEYPPGTSSGGETTRGETTRGKRLGAKRLGEEMVLGRKSQIHGLKICMWFGYIVKYPTFARSIHLPCLLFTLNIAKSRVRATVTIGNFFTEV